MATESSAPNLTLSSRVLSVALAGSSPAKTSPERLNSAPVRPIIQLVHSSSP